MTSQTAFIASSAMSTAPVAMQNSICSTERGIRVSSVCRGVSPWVKPYQWRATAPAKPLRRFAEISPSSNLSRLLAKGLSGFRDSRKGCQKTSLPPQFITLQAKRSAPVTIGAKARSIRHPARSSSFFIQTLVGSFLSTSCAVARLAGGSKLCAPANVRRPTKTGESNLNSICEAA